MAVLSRSASDSGTPILQTSVWGRTHLNVGWFDDVDIALADHIGAGYSVGYGLIQSALNSIKSKPPAATAEPRTMGAVSTRVFRAIFCPSH